MGAAIAQLTCATAQQRGNVALDDRATIATSTGQFNLMSGALIPQSRLGQDCLDGLRIGSWIDRFDAAGDTDGENTSLVEGNSNLGVVQPHIATH